MSDPILRDALRVLLDDLERVGTLHEEMYDTDVREQMFDAVARSFLKPEPDYAWPDEFGLFDKEANTAVRHALRTYVVLADVRATYLGLDTAARLAAFQDREVTTSGSAQHHDAFFGWIDRV